MEQILSGLSGVQCYLDDILVTSEMEEELLRNLDAALEWYGSESVGLCVTSGNLLVIYSSLSWAFWVVMESLAESCLLHWNPFINNRERNGKELICVEKKQLPKENNAFRFWCFNSLWPHIALSLCLRCVSILSGGGVVLHNTKWQEVPRHLCFMHTQYSREKPCADLMRSTGDMSLTNTCWLDHTTQQYFGTLVI